MSDTTPRMGSAVPDDRWQGAAIATGNQAAMAQVYERHGAAVYSVARGLCGSVLADDVVQEVFLALWLRPERFDPTRGSLSGFLTMQAHGRAIDLLRSDGARRAREEADSSGRPDNAPTTEGSAIAVLAGDDLDHAMTRLPLSEQEAIVLAYYGGRTYCEVARALNQPEGTIKGRIRTGLQRLRVLLADGNAAPTA